VIVLFLLGQFKMSFAWSVQDELHFLIGFQD